MCQTEKPGAISAFMTLRVSTSAPKITSLACRSKGQNGMQPISTMFMVWMIRRMRISNFLRCGKCSSTSGEKICIRLAEKTNIDISPMKLSSAPSRSISPV